MTIRRIMLLALSGLLAVNAPLFAEGDPAAGRKKAGNCIGCHGVSSLFNVYPTYRVPRLGGQHQDYIVAALSAYKNGERNHSTMHAQAVDLSDQEMKDIAAYFATFKE